MISDDTWAAFHTWGWDARQYATSTRDLYTRRVKAAERDIDVPLYQASAADLAGWHRTLPATASSRNIARQALVAFYDFLIERTTRTTNPARALPSYRYPDRAPRALDPAAVAQVLDADVAVQWRFALSLLFHTALRATEARRLEWTDVTDGWVTVVVKGGAQRILPMHDDTVGLANLWRAGCPSPRWVFPSPVRDACLSDSAWRENIKRAAASAGVIMTPHVARHSAATRMVRQGVDVRTVQALLGHASLATTSKYLRVWDQQLQGAVASIRWAS